MRTPVALACELAGSTNCTVDNTVSEVVREFLGDDYLLKTPEEKDAFWGNVPKQNRGLFWLKGNTWTIVSFGNPARWSFKTGTESESVKGGYTSVLYMFGERQWSFGACATCTRFS